METIWHYLLNQFVRSTNRNFKKALKLSDYHDAFLNQMRLSDPMEPDWTTLYNRYHPFHLNYVAAYSGWVSAGGLQEGQTLDLDQWLLLLVKRVNTWDIMVQSVAGFEKDTANYKGVFPNGRKPFGNGAKATRVNAVDALATRMGTFPALNMVKPVVDAFYSQLDTVRDTQQGAKGITKASSETLELRRIEVMTEQYRDLGFLINKAAEQPLTIQPFFDLAVLRESSQVIFTGILDPSETEAVLIHTFMADDEIQLEIIGDPAPAPGSLVQFYLATTPGGTDSTAVAIEANAAPTTITAAAFGIADYAAHRYLTAINTNAMELKYVVELE